MKYIKYQISNTIPKIRLKRVRNTRIFLIYISIFNSYLYFHKKNLSRLNTKKEFKFIV